MDLHFVDWSRPMCSSAIPTIHLFAKLVIYASMGHKHVEACMHTCMRFYIRTIIIHWWPLTRQAIMGRIHFHTFGETPIISRSPPLPFKAFWLLHHLIRIFIRSCCYLTRSLMWRNKQVLNHLQVFFLSIYEFSIKILTCE